MQYIQEAFEQLKALEKAEIKQRLHEASDSDTNKTLDDIRHSSQKYSSAGTSINSAKLPAVFKMVKFKPNTINLDYGGGKFDNAVEFLAKQGVTSLVYDPFNRTTEHNSKVLNMIRKAGGADTATLSNVLNVIAEEEIRIEVLENIKKLLKPSGILYITVYEGKGNNEGGESQKGQSFQLNRKTADYLEEIQRVFPNASRKGKLIVATK